MGDEAESGDFPPVIVSICNFFKDMNIHNFLNSVFLFDKFCNKFYYKYYNRENKSKNSTF